MVTAVENQGVLNISNRVFNKHVSEYPRRIHEIGLHNGITKCKRILNEFEHNIYKILVDA